MHWGVGVGWSRGEFKFLIKSGCGLSVRLHVESVKAAACWPLDPLDYPMTKANVLTAPPISNLTSSLPPSHTRSFIQSLGLNVVTD